MCVAACDLEMRVRCLSGPLRQCAQPPAVTLVTESVFVCACVLHGGPGPPSPRTVPVGEKWVY